MSAQINATYVDPKIADIRSSVSLKTDQIPFLLMPVRVETRFMQVSVTTTQVQQPAESLMFAAKSTGDQSGSTVEDALEAMGNLNILTLNTQSKLSGVTLRAVTTEVNRIASTLKDMGTISIKEKGWLKQIYNGLDADVQGLSKTASTAYVSDAKQLATALGALKKAIHAAPHEKVRTLPQVTKMIEKANAVDYELSALTGKREQIPYLNVKNKKDLYIYITKVLDKAHNFYSDADIRSEGFTEIVRNQSSRLGDLHKSIQSKLTSLKASIAGLHSDKNWKKFIDETVDKRIAALQSSGKKFADATHPKIAARPHPKDLHTGDIVLHGVQTLVKIKRFNAKYPNEKPEELLKKFQAELQPRIDKLGDFLKRPIRGATENRKTSIQKLFGTISTEVGSISTKARKPNTDPTKPGKLPITGKIPLESPPIINKPVTSSLKSTGAKLTSTGSTSILPDDSLTALNIFAGTQTTGTTTQPQYVTTTVTENQLWVRIYPDDVFLRTHEEYLTSAEMDSGKQFWKTWWSGSNDADLEIAAWRTLCAALGTKRASWVARTLDPRTNPNNTANLAAKPSQNMTDAITILTTINGELKKINTVPEPYNVFLSLHPGTVLTTLVTSFQQAYSELNTLSSVQAFLIDKFKVLLVQASSVIGILNEKQLGLTAAQRTQFSTTITALYNLTVSFNSCQNYLGNITAVDDKVFITALIDPLIYPQPQFKPKDWNSAPTSNCLPDKFVVITQSGGVFKHVVVGNQIPANLQLGLDPSKFSNGSVYGLDVNGNLILDAGLKWMVDYPEAVAKGMGITLTLDATLYNNGIDKLIVVGVKNTDAINSQIQLETLIRNHIYSADGMSFLKTGTPTNNTQDKKSGYGIDDDVDHRYNIEIKGQRYNSNVTNPYLKPDGKYFSDALGISNGVTQYANNAENLEIANAFAMNRSLWSGTMGHYMEEMWDALFPYDNIRRAENFFVNNVTGRGIVPAVRIGMQPYGILTTTAFSQLQLYSNMPTVTRAQMAAVTPWEAPGVENLLQQRFEMRLHQFLNMLKDVWVGLSYSVIHSGNLNVGDQQQRFIGMLGLHATSLDYFYRYSINVAKGGNMINSATSANFTSGDPAGPTALYERFKQHIKQGMFYPSFNFKDEDPLGNPGVIGWKITDQTYSRIKDQIENSRLFDARHINDSFPVLGSLVDTVPASDSLLSILPGKNVNYIEWLLAAKADDILGGNQINDPVRIPTNNMLFLMLRQALLQAYQEAALNILQKENLMTEVVRRESGNEERYFYRLPAGVGGYKNYYLTKWHYMFKYLLDLVNQKAMDAPPAGNLFYNFINTGPLSVGRYLDRILDANLVVQNNTHLQFFDKLRKVREGMGYLKRASTSALEILMAEHIDITSYRLDAWLLGMAHQRLQKQRAMQPGGIFLGAYGYVENLRRDSNKQTTNDPKLPGFKLPANKPVYKDPDNDGLIHAPSQSQAIAAAVLRNAYKANNEAGDIANRLAVNLSSARVRMALKLIDGIRNGQEVGALLGFQFERGLHDRYKTIELDKFIQPFRKAFPLQQSVDVVANGAPAYVSLVVNGQAVLDLVYAAIQWLGNNSSQAGGKTVAEILKVNNYQYLPAKIKTTIDGACTVADDKVKIYNAIIEEIDRMADAFDAMGDLAVSESVYQIVQGNHVRAAAVLTALAEGKNIPDPQIIETQRNGTLVTQRVMINFSTVSNSVTPPGWDVKNSVRYFTEPSFNNWLGLTVGSAAKLKVVFTITSGQNAPVKQSESIAILGWQPLDFFELPGGEEELREVLVSWYRMQAIDYTSIITVDTRERGVNWLADDKSVSDLYMMLKHVRNMLGNARYAGVGDLKTPGSVLNSSNPGNHNVAEFQNRVVNGAFNQLSTFINDVQSMSVVQQVLNGTKAVNDVIVNSSDSQMLYWHLLKATMLGIPNALTVNLVPAGTPEKRGTALLQQVLNILKLAKSRFQVANGIFMNMPNYSSDKLKVEKLSELAKAVLGKSFLAIPTYGAVGTEPVSSQLALPAAQSITRQGGLVAVEEWLQNIARIRKRLYDTQMLMQMGDVYDLPVPSVKPVQLSYKNGDYWLGIEYPSNYVPDGDKLSLVLINEGVFKVPGAPFFSSLIIDEWIEIIPNKDVTSGIVFNYNQPNAAAPQSMLLAVTPNVTNRWEWDDLVHTVIDTMELAKVRAVEPDHLDSSILNHVLPGIVSEVAPPSLKNQDHNPLGVQVVMDFSDVKPKTV